MTEKQTQLAVELTRRIIEDFYYYRDIDAVLTRLSKDVTWIGPGEREQKYSFADIRDYFEIGRDAVPSCEVAEDDFRAESLGEEFCLVTGGVIIRTTQQSHMLLEVYQRLSFIFRLEEGVLKVVHMHLSNPYADMQRDEFFPREVGTQTYEYLQRLLREKTEVIDMIASNINGGLKGSNDDDTFSFFYVNEGLPRMLGYTYEEFMEKTGGTAVGAVYPPDLPSALADCERCFAQGPVYSSEYRMEKKDGSHMWVLDSGRKTTDSQGRVKINSIITDITPMKQTLFELELERERYRIAMENISDVMCEYDILKDLFVTYQQMEINGNHELERFEIPSFLKTALIQKLVHPDDIQLLTDVCLGNNDQTIEIRTNFFRLDGTWHWIRLRFSAVTDNANKPVRSIGMMKDVTDEKKMNQELLAKAQTDGLTQLLNQTAAPKAIQSILASAEHFTGALLVLDLDHFKLINDTRGHLFGNDVLIETARILRKYAKPGDIAGRIGGDEFVLFLCDEAQDAVEDHARQILTEINHISKSGHIFVSCSLGIASIDRQISDYNQLFTLADSALYQAKGGGRNRFVILRPDSHRESLSG